VVVAACERCGTQAPPVAAYCAVCGHRLGQPPGQPTVIQVQQPPVDCSGVRTVCDGCLGCFSWLVVGILVLLLIAWIVSC
jgi:hypothetical protein